jgi:hypothetical protein
MRWLPVVLFLTMYAHLAYAKGYIEKNGDVLQVIIPAVGLASTIIYEQGYEGTLQFSKSFITTELVTEALKETIQKSRPNGSCCKSFPSGHTSAAFMGAAFIHERYGWGYAIPAYIGATYVGYSRIEADKHFPEDVVAGALIGTLSSFYFTGPYTKEGVIVPIAAKDFYGMDIDWIWQ